MDEKILQFTPKHIHDGTDAPNVSAYNLKEVYFGLKKDYDPSNLSDGAGETVTISIPNARLKDFTIVSFSLDLQGILLTSYVSTSGIVSVRLQNETGGAINLGKGDLSVIVIRNFNT